MKPLKTYGGKTDAALDLLTTSGLKLTERDFAAISVACADQAGLAAAGQADLAAELDLVFHNNNVLPCWACGEPGAIVRAEAGPGEQIACERCDESEREAAFRSRAIRRAREAHA